MNHLVSKDKNGLWNIPAEEIVSFRCSFLFMHSFRNEMKRTQPPRLDGRFYFVSVEQKGKEVTQANFSTFRSFVYCVWSMGACAPIDQTLRFHSSIAFGRWAPVRPSTKRNRRTNEQKSLPV